MRRLLTLLQIFVTTTTATKRMSHHLFVKVGIKITIQQEQHFSKRICAVLSSFLKSGLLLYRYTKDWWKCKTNLCI